MPHTTDRRVTSTTPLLPSSQSRSTSPRAPRDPSQTRFLPLKHLAFRRRRTPPVQVVPAIITSILLIALIFTAWDISSYGQCYFRPLCRMLGTGMTAREEVWWMNAGPYAPRRSLGEGGGKKGLPRGCEVDQVTVVGIFAPLLAPWLLLGRLREGSERMLRPAPSPCRSLSHQRRRQAYPQSSQEAREEISTRPSPSWGIDIPQ